MSGRRLARWQGMLLLAIAVAAVGLGGVGGDTADACVLTCPTRTTTTLGETGYLTVDRGIPSPGSPNPGTDCPSGELTSVIVATPATLAPGSETELTALHYAPGSKVSVHFCSRVGGPPGAVELGELDVDANGQVTQRVTIPTDAVPGPHTLAIVGCERYGGTLVSYAAVTVVGPSEAGTLPVTGSEPVKLSTVGALLILGGAALSGAMRGGRRALTPSATR